MALDAVKNQTNELAMFQMESRTKIQETEMENQSAFIQQHSINSICDKLQLRQRKRRNLVIFKLNESNADREDVDALVRDVGAVAIVNSVYRVGATVENRPRPLVVQFATDHDRDQLNNNSTEPQGADTVEPDLSSPRYDETSVYPRENYL